MSTYKITIDEIWEREIVISAETEEDANRIFKEYKEESILSDELVKCGELIEATKKISVVENYKKLELAKDDGNGQN